MHQTFYIDIDEEITSIVERLKASKAKEVIVVVPKRALLIQSIINLKLLKKEGDKLKKELIIVTQDKLGRLLVEKAGLIAEQRLDEVENEDTRIQEESVQASEEKIDFGEKFIAQKTELEDLGSADYLEAEPRKVSRTMKIGTPEKATTEKILNKELVTDANSGIQNKFFSKKAAQSLDMVKNIDIRQKQKDLEEEILVTKKEPQKKTVAFQEEAVEKKDLVWEEKANDFFSKSERPKKKEEDPYQKIQVGKKAWGAFFWFCFVAILLVVLVGGYLYLPKATVIIKPKISIKSLDLEVKGESVALGANFSENLIQAEKIELEEEITEAFPVTGSKSDSSKKARGTITIYNEFSSSPQPLVATTRFLSEGGLLFRLEKSIVVPGTTNVGGENKVGAIEAEVVADKAGSEFNIGPGKFTIPGFQGSGGGKYEKIYAKSSKAMQGGGNSESTVKMVSATDIANAKNALATKLKENLKQKVKEQIGDEKILLDDAINFGEINFSSSAQEGMIGEEFNLTAKTKARFLVFPKDQLENLAEEKIIASSGIRKEQLGPNAIKFEFGKADADFDNGKITIRVNLKANIFPDLNLEEMKKEILGKSIDDFSAYIKQFKELDGAKVEFSVPFGNGKIPPFSRQVELRLDNN